MLAQIAVVRYSWRMDLEWIDEFIGRDTERARRFLATMLRAVGLSQQEVDRRLGRRHGFTSNVLTGRVELKKEHVALFLLVAGIHPNFFYNMLYPKDRPFGPIQPGSDFPNLLGLAETGIDPEAMPPPPPRAPQLDSDELRRLIDDAVQKALAAHEAKRKRHPRKRRPAAARASSSGRA